jgi:hypothetical protein
VIHPACARRCFVISPIGIEGSQERDLKPRSLMEGRHRARLISHVRALEAAGWPGTGLPGVSLRHPADRPCNVLPAAREFGVPERFSVRPATSPPLRRQRGTQLYSTFQRELDSLWDVNGGD